MKKRKSTTKASTKKSRKAMKKAARRKAAGVAKKPAAPKKTAPKFATVADYLARVPEPARSALNQMRAAIREVMPEDAAEVISYNIPAFRHNKVLVWYAAFAHHCSLFPTAAVIEQFKDELTGYTAAKGTVQFPLDRPLPLVLIKKLVAARVAQSETPKH
jgi:uncharacterized protein YdhG (YjbR/CyaY superfamily)